MNNFNELNLSKVVRSVPNIRFDRVEFELSMLDVFGISKNISEYLGLVFLRLGFSSEDNILLYEYKKETHSFKCLVNDKDDYDMKLNNVMNQLFDLEMVIRNNNNEKAYSFEPLELSEVGYKISCSWYCIEEGGRKIIRYLSLDNAKFSVNIDGYTLDLELVAPNDLILPMFDDNGKCSKYILDVEDALLEYFSTIRGTISIIDVYDDLCRIFNYDISIYPKFLLKISYVENEKKLTDLIELRNGVFDKIVLNDSLENTMISLDSKDNWDYSVLADTRIPVDFRMSCYDGKMSCTFSMNEEYDFDDYTLNSMRYDIDMAMSYMIDTKRKVKTLFDKNKR